MRALFAIAFLFLASCGDSEQEQKAKDDFNNKWENAVIVRICFDGTRIYRLPDGKFYTYVAFGGSSLVDDPTTVCAKQ